MKKILAGLFAVLVLASLLIITIQAENETLPPGRGRPGGGARTVRQAGVTAFQGEV